MTLTIQPVSLATAQPCDGFRLLDPAAVARGMGLPESVARPPVVELTPEVADWPITPAEWHALRRFYSPPCMDYSAAGRRRS